MRILTLFFVTLTMFSCMWICGGITLIRLGTGDLEAQLAAQPQPKYAGLSEAESNKLNASITKFAAGATSGISVSFILCTGIPALLLFSLFSLICYSSWQNDVRHREMMIAQQERNSALFAMAQMQSQQKPQQIVIMQPPQQLPQQPPQPRIKPGDVIPRNRSNE